jgi:hypothetical protein
MEGKCSCAINGPRYPAPGILTPVQYYDGVHRDNPETQAIKRLMVAVLADAVRCFQTYANAQSRAGRRMFGEAEWWILDRNSDGPFTFQAICETLGMHRGRRLPARRESGGRCVGVRGIVSRYTVVSCAAAMMRGRGACDRR